GNVGIGTTTVDGPLDIVGLASSTGTPISIDGNDSLVKETSLQIYKEDVEELSFGLETLMQLQPREFNWIDEKGGFHDFGFIAEEINAVNPLLAQYDHGNLQGVKYSKMTALLTKAMQELVVEVRGLGGFGGEVDILGVTTGSTEPIFENNTSIDILGTTTESNEPVLTLNENGIIAQLQFDDIEMDTNLLSTLTKKIKATLEWLGMRLEDGVAYVREIVTDKLTAETVRIKRMEIVDSVTGEIYCTWIENGDWKKELGDCDSAIGEYVSESEPESEPESPPILETTTPSDEPPLEILDTTTPTE
ncbi:tail fiber domain-containing protein, partial [Patescibacteria group bacterium]|nr:tail fiber domain-containing protein [Patescibacteria group bacterium]